MLSTKEEQRRRGVARSIHAIRTSDLVGLDIETTGLNPRTGSIRMVQISTPDHTAIIDAFSVDVTPILKALSKTTVVAHNSKFEWQHIFHHYGIALDNVKDTMLAAQVLACGDLRNTDFSLEALVLDEFGVELDKKMQASDWSGELTGRQRKYAAQDAQVLLPLYARLTGYLAEKGLVCAAEIEYAALPAVARMELEGMPADKAAWDAYADEVARKAKTLERRMLELPNLPEPEPISQAWALQGEDCKAMLKAAGLDVEGTTAKDLKPYADHPLVSNLLAYRKAKGEQKANLKAGVLGHAPDKPPAPAPPWNFGSPQQVNEICYQILGFELPKTDEATLLRYTEHHPFFGCMLEHRKLKKRASTYGPGWFKDAYEPATGRVYPSWWQIGTSTGRFACSTPNAQQIPNDGPYRSFFKAPKGRTFVDMDYSQIEVRVYAKIVEEKALLGLFEAGKDTYKATAAKLLGKAEEDVTKEERQKAKAIMLGLLYGLSDAGLPAYAFKHYSVEIRPDEAEKLIEGFFELYPSIAANHSFVLEELERNGSVSQKTLAGRRRDDIINRNEAINAPIQGSAADGLKIALGLVYKRLKRFEGAAFICGVFHDEMLVECVEADAEEVANIVREAMKEAMDELVNAGGPTVKIEVEGNITSAWTKE